MTLIDNPCDLHNLFIKTAPNQPYLILSNKSHLLWNFSLGIEERVEFYIRLYIVNSHFESLFKDLWTTEYKKNINYVKNETYIKLLNM